jgi:hypothetical protein
MLAPPGVIAMLTLSALAVLNDLLFSLLLSQSPLRLGRDEKERFHKSLNWGR